jgi:NitT/TauT family transport system substrate-binding protein
MKTHRLQKLLAGGFVFALALAGCSNETSSSADADDGELQTVSVGVMPVAVSAAFEYGTQRGIFEQHGLEVNIQSGQGGAAALPAVSGGSLDIAIGNPLSIMIAADQGLDMRIVSGYAAPPIENDMTNAIVVQADSGIQTWKDLEGKTVAVNAVQTQGDLVVKGAVANDGGDPDEVKFTELGFPDMEAQLEIGNVDAIWQPEPFLTSNLNNPERANLGSANATVIDGLPPLVTFTSADYAETHSELLDTFETALAEVLEAAPEDPEGFRQQVSEYLDMPMEVVEAMTIDELGTEIAPNALPELADLAFEYGYIDEEVDLDTIVLE